MIARMVWVIVLVCSAGIWAGCGQITGSPNIILLYIDDLGWSDTGFMGSRYYETPHIDRLASESMVFTNAYANAPNCAPSRACLMSGQYTPRHGIYTVSNSERGEPQRRKLIPIPTKTVLDTGFVTIAEALHQAGYVCASIGKWHLGEGENGGPLSQGFDVNAGGNSAGSPSSYFSPYNNPDLTDGPEGEYLTERLTNEALRFIENYREQPFFLYLTHYAVHTPFQGKTELVQKYKGKPPHNGQDNPTYAAMVESMDASVGRLLDRLDELSLTDNTVVIFTSDNGGYAGATTNAPLRGFKGMLYEGGIREPLTVRWPGVIKAGARCDEPVIGIDLYPTMLQIAGIEPPAHQMLDGVSLMPLLTDSGTLDRTSIFWHFPAYLQAGAGERRRQYMKPFRTTPASAVRCGDWKLIEFYEDGQLELYNLRDDTGESDNRADALPDKRDELHRILKTWRQSTNAPVPAALNPEYNP